MRQTFATLSIILAIASHAIATPAPSGDGICGQAAGGATCQGSSFGNCCSRYGYCGSTDTYCGAGCQSGFGTCNGSNSPGGLTVSQDATCGKGVTCVGSGFGDCCSASGWCGSTADYCAVGCQSAFGKCTGSSTSAAPSPATTGKSTATSASGASATTGATRAYTQRSLVTTAPACNYKSYTSYYELDNPPAGADGMYSEAVAGCKNKCDTTAGCKVYFFQKMNYSFKKATTGRCFIDDKPWQPTQLQCDMGTMQWNVGYELV
ncbi:hypothetical protein PspLS_08681 [Pyricularia sp. CBS 133598]|nr:hypothetical protein PspLS_08681 [Pyricularia sp. CBS 133598]